MQLYPLVYIVSSSLSSVKAVLSGRVWLWPVDFSLDGYRAVINYSKTWIGYANTLVYTVVGTGINVVLTILAAYPLSRRDMAGGAGRAPHRRLQPVLDGARLGRHHH